MIFQYFLSDVCVRARMPASSENVDSIAKFVLGLLLSLIPFFLKVSFHMNIFAPFYAQ